MDLQLRILCMLAGAFVLFVIGRLLFQRRMDESHSLIWMPLGFVALIAGFFPDLIVHLASWLGLQEGGGDTLVLVVIIILLIIIVLHNTVDISMFRARTHELSMNVSMLNSEVRHLIELTRSLSDVEPGDMAHVRDLVRQDQLAKKETAAEEETL